MPTLRRRVTFCLSLFGAGFSGMFPLTSKGATIVNGDFEDGLAAWEIRGSVAASTGIAVVTDENATASLLFQAVLEEADIVTVEFDFRNALSDTVPAGRLADTFFASLYFTDNLAALDIPAGTYDRAVPLFDLDANGSFNVNGSIGASTKGADWSLFRGSFVNTHAFVVPAFELRELNLINDDSAVALDNVFLIPEGGALSFALIGGGFLGLGRHRANEPTRGVEASS